MAGGAQEDDDIITAINVTPLVDVVLVLLIILMVTASYIVSKAIPMDLPNADTGETTPQQLSISIDREGMLYLDAEQVDRAELRRRVRSYAEGNENARAIIAADGGIAHRQVVQIIDLLRSENIKKFAFNVNPSDLETSAED